MSGLEAIGIAASIIQVADVGIKLAENIHAYADSVQSADAKLSKVASDVRLTANLVGHVGSLFKDEELGRSAREKEIRAAKDCIRRCEGTYAEVEGYLVKAKKSKWMFPLGERKLDVLNARLDQLKNDLHLMLSIVKNRNDLKAAVEHRDHLEQRDVYFLKEIDVLRRAQRASEVRYRTLKTAYERAAENESDDDETVIDDEDHADGKASTKAQGTVDIEDQAALSAALKIGLGDMTTTSLTALPVSRSPSPLPTPKITSSEFIKPSEDVFTISSPISPIYDDDSTRFDQHDLAHLSSHLRSLLSQITDLQQHLQEENSTRASVEDTHRFLTSFNQVNDCMERAQNSFHTTSILDERASPDCTHNYYLKGRGSLPPPLASEPGQKLDSLVDKPDNFSVSAQGFLAGASRTRTSAIESTIDIISYGYNSIPSPFKQRGSTLSPPPVAGPTSPGMVENAMGAVRSGLAWLPSPRNVSFGLGSSANGSDVDSDEEEDEAEKRNGGFPWWKKEVVESGPDVDEVERLLRMYTNVLDEA